MCLAHGIAYVHAQIWNVCTMLEHADACNAAQLTGLCVHHIQVRQVHLGTVYLG